MKHLLQKKAGIYAIGLFIAGIGFLAGGCESLRLAPGERQKENAWLHNRTAATAAQTAEAEDSSQELQDLTELSEVQSRAFSSYFGLPKEFPPAESVEDILSESSRRLAEGAIADSIARPDGWEMADTAMELGIGVFALLGGVYGTAAVRFLKQAKAKSKALREIIAGNELFKTANQSKTKAFKQAHANQSSETRQIVTEMKS